MSRWSGVKLTMGSPLELVRPISEELEKVREDAAHFWVMQARLRVPIRTGKTWRSIHWYRSKIDGRIVLSVGKHFLDDRVLYIEYGTHNRPAHPFIQPATHITEVYMRLRYGMIRTKLHGL